MAFFTTCIRLGKMFGLWLLLLLTAGAAEPYTLIDGTIGEAPYQVAVPAVRSGNLLILAHGLRPVDNAVSIELELDQTAHGQLLADGWMIAATAYRRNGMIVADAMADVVLLCDHLEDAYGPLAMVLLEGQSMGGAIVTHLAETRPDRFHGALAIGAALQVRDSKGTRALNHEPKFPVLFLSNRSEVSGPKAYAESAVEAPVPPVVWTIDRDGHVNVNQSERLLALEALIAWITFDTIEPGRDITIKVAPERTVVFDDGRAIGRVIDITDNYGNLFIDFQAEDFDRVGIHPGDRFRLTIDQISADVTYGTTFSDVPRGEWIAFPTAEGDTIIAINYGSAFEHTQAAVGDRVVIETLD